jgi:hypothetical protein
MMRQSFRCVINSLATLLMVALATTSSYAQTPPDAETLIAAQRTAMAKFARMDGLWRGPAWVILPSGDKHHLTQTERIGPLLNGTLKLIEGRGYEADGRDSFSAVGLISFNAQTGRYRFHSHAQGLTGDYTITPTDDGYTWEIPAGPMTIRYTAVVKDGVMKEVGDRITPGKEPVRFFEMTLTRIGNTDWPAGNAVPAK